MTSYILHCSVCQKDFGSKSEWHIHLTNDQHQSVARQECLKEWAEPGFNVKDQCIILYSTFPVTRKNGGARKVIQHFSRDSKTFVTDFVWWDDRPHLALLQFESRKRAKKVVSESNGHDVLVGKHRIQIKWAGDLWDVEWLAILPKKSGTSEVVMEEDETSTVDNVDMAAQSLQSNGIDEKENTAVECHVPLKRKLENGVSEDDTPLAKRLKNKAAQSTPLDQDNKFAVSELNEYTQSQGWKHPEYKFENIKGRGAGILWSCCVVVNNVEYKPLDTGKWVSSKQEAKRRVAAICLTKLLPKKIKGTDSRIQEKAKKESAKAMESNGSPENHKVPNTHVIQRLGACLSSSDSLIYQFWNIRKSVLIPDQEYDNVMKVQNVLLSMLRKNDRTVEVNLFRNWHLKLRNPKRMQNRDVLFYTYSKRSQPDFPSSFTWLPDNTVVNILKNETEGQSEFSVLETLDTSNPDQMGGKFQHNKTKVSFTLATFKKYIVEAQICRLLEHMCAFDSRLYSLLTLAFFWTSLNDIDFDDPSFNERNSHCGLAADTLTLEWLVIHFFCHNGLIPSVREIQERPHEVIKERFMGIDVGFHVSSDFVQEWIRIQEKNNPNLPKEDYSNELFLLNVMELFQEFLEFYGSTLRKESWILNSRDGEVISTDKFLSTDPDPETDAQERSSSWSSRMTNLELAGLRLLQKTKTIMNGHEDAVEFYKRCNYKVNFKDWNIYMVHPFIFTWKFSVPKQISLIFEAMGRSSKQLKTFLNMRRSNGINAAKKRFGTLENVLRLDKKILAKLKDSSSST